MNRRNYEREMQRVIAKRNGTRPRLLLHCCCGPCSGPVLEFLAEYFDVTVLWYNPNIYPVQEYEKRYSVLLRLIDCLGLSGRVRVIRAEYEDALWRTETAGLENEPEGGKRCAECFRVRLRRAAEFAAAGGYDYYCSTLTLSRHKDAVLINAVGEAEAGAAGAVWLPSEFKKQGREDRSLEICEEFGLYRQLYCGCEPSLRRRESGPDTGKEHSVEQ